MKAKANIKNLDTYKQYLKFITLVEEFLTGKGYLKLRLPVLSPSLIPESSIEVFETEFLYKDKKQKLYLTPSPELFIKRLLVGGVGDCYYLGKSFRNYELQGSLHLVEFNILEFYKIGFDYMDMAGEVLDLLCFLDNKLDINLGVNFEKWEKIKVSEAFEKYADISESDLFNKEKFIKKAKEKGYETKGFGYEDLFSQVYTNEVEKNLGTNGRPTLIYDYPKEFASLAKMNEDGITPQRFEFYINGIELGNCFSELVDLKEQSKRFTEEQEKRKEKNMIGYPSDADFLESLKKGLPECSGIAIGFDRLAMIFLGVDTIEDLKLISIK